MSDTAATPAPTVWPAFQARDAHAMVEFLTSVLGFRKTAVYAEGDTVVHAQLDWPEGGGVMFGSHKPGGDWTREPGNAGMYVVTDHVDEIYERVRRSDAATVVRPLQDTDYGNHEFTCADPEGNLWSFGTYRGEPAPS
ncbi:glyoxalase [Streptomonospora sp. PA3]|uniref:VOC family protein n=1 Tax=Streptomonospora sp. PA3 TaxID=2607326 RepID=UPI0012DF31D1|nr:VOC family protein [Streptomonospora sp. PA3]MUL43732.1 glyoxalase [Streptomonospora sp. PA3]